MLISLTDEFVQDLVSLLTELRETTEKRSVHQGCIGMISMFEYHIERGKQREADRKRHEEELLQKTKANLTLDKWTAAMNACGITRKGPYTTGTIKVFIDGKECKETEK